MQVGARRSPRRPHRPERLTPLEPLALGDLDRVEVEVERVEAQPVVDDDEATREEELGHQRDPPAVGRNDRRPLGRRVVGAAVGRAGEAVDDPARAEAGGGLLPADRPREAAAPESLGSDRPVERLHALLTPSSTWRSRRWTGKSRRRICTCPRAVRGSRSRSRTATRHVWAPGFCSRSSPTSAAWPPA